MPIVAQLSGMDRQGPVGSAMIGAVTVRSVRMAMPDVGEQAPAFEIEATDGSLVRLDDHRGRKVVLFFYPRDDTSGCTVEVCGFRDRLHEIADRGAVLLGVSDDPVKSHQRFTSKFSLNFPLLADVKREAIKSYGVWVEKKRGGAATMGTQRATFLIDEDGIVAEVWPDVTPDGHAEEVIRALDA